MEFLIIIVIGIFILYAIEATQEAITKRRSKKLDKIAHAVLTEFDFNREREEIRSLGSKYVPKAYRCPECNGMLILGEGIYGKFLGCNRYPGCNYFSFVNSGDNEKKKSIRVQDVYKVYETSKCPKCSGELVLRNGIYGKFLGCSRYPKCKYTRST